MTTENSPESGVHRLVDIVVEEVSLVDRAANKHRFLIVKRSEPMDESTTQETTSEQDPVVDDDTLQTDDADVNDGATDDSPNDTLALALEALEHLTSAVEELGTVAPEQAQTRVKELGAALREISERLTEKAGSEGDADDQGDEGTGAPDPGLLDGVLDSVRATLTRVGTLLDGASRPAAQPDPTPAPTSVPAPTTAPVPAATTAPSPTIDPTQLLDARLTELLTSVRQLGTMLTAQQQRLSRLEKRFGLPNSTPSGEHPRRRPDDEDVGWPLDLNRPCDRDSVDKTVSFHDL